MDSFEWNKIAGAVLFALLVAFGLSIFSELIMEREAPEPPGYKIATADDGAEQVQQEEKPIAVLLASADAGAGETVARKCVACHTFGDGEANKVGPNLWGIVDRPIASHEGYEYSDAMHAFAEEAGDWTYEHLNTYLTNPAGTVPQTKMTFAGLKGDTERANVIAYLRTLAADPVPLPEVTPADEEVPGAEEPVPAEDVEAEAAAEGELPEPEGTQPQAEGAAPAEEPQSAEDTQPAEDAQPTTDEQGAMEPAADEDTAAAAEAPSDEQQTAAAEEPATSAEDEASATEDHAMATSEAPAEGEQMAATEAPAQDETSAPAEGEQQMAAAETSATAMPSGDVDAGKNFARRCLACHSFDQGGPNKVGPHLFGVFGRPIASVDDFTYSEAMIAFSEGGSKTWDAATLDIYLADPRGAVPGAKMIFPGIKDEGDRANVIAYLATLTE
jgi:cytochrome c